MDSGNIMRCHNDNKWLLQKTDNGLLRIVQAIVPITGVQFWIYSKQISKIFVLRRHSES